MDTWFLTPGQPRRSYQGEDVGDGDGDDNGGDGDEDHGDCDGSDGPVIMLIRL